MYIAHLSTAITLNQTVLNRMVFQKQNGHRVVALCPDDEWTADIKAKGIEVMVVPFVRHSALYSFTTAAIQTYIVCRREKFDVVHTHTFLPGIVGRVMARLAGIPAVVHTFHSWPIHKPRGKLFTIIYKALELMAAFLAHLILFQNSDDMESWSQIPFMPTGKAVLIGNGIDSRAILQKAQPGARERIRQEFHIDPDTTLIIMIARLELYKGHVMLLNALRQILSSTDHKIAVLFVGIGKDQPVIEEEVQRLSLSDVVQFTGYRLDVPDIVSACDISVLTSRYEGIPRALMESMVLGKPVVATDVPGTRTLVRSGENGLLVENDNYTEMAAAITSFIENPQYSAQLAERGRQTVLEEYDEHKIAEREEKIFQQIVDTGLPRFSDWKYGADV